MKYSIDEMISRFRNGTLDVSVGDYTTENDQGENALVYVRKNELHFVTYQSNNYIRHNVYYKDGTKEEYYDK